MISIVTDSLLHLEVEGGISQFLLCSILATAMSGAVWPPSNASSLTSAAAARMQVASRALQAASLWL
eukprot:2189492-Alexandrium_andersonii.AAC.1